MGALNASGVQIFVITDDPIVADVVAAQPVPARTLIQIDSGEIAIMWWTATRPWRLSGIM